MKVSASKAAKMTGKSVPTITRAINSNRLSAERKPTGGYLIEVSELERVFTIVTVDPNAKPNSLPHETPNDNSALQATLEAQNKLLAEREATIDDLRTRLDKSDEERRASNARLEDYRDRALATAEAMPKAGLWARLTGKG